MVGQRYSESKDPNDQKRDLQLHHRHSFARLYPMSHRNFSFFQGTLCKKERLFTSVHPLPFE